jgi:hypothetical protein
MHDQNMSTSLSPEIEAFESQLLTLEPHERARLASRLIASLDELNPEDTEALWVQEAQHRYEAYRTGDLSSRPVAEAMQDIRSRLA